MDCFVAFDGDHIGARVGRAVLADDVGEVRRVSQAIDAGEDLWRKFAENVGGSMISFGGDEGSMVIDASHLAEMPPIAQQYAETVGATVSVGVGTKLSESAKALVVAKLRGGNRIVMWDEAMQPEYDKATVPESERDKIAKEYLEKAEPPKPKEHSEKEAVGAHTSHQTGENHGPGAGFSVQHKPGFSDLKPSDEAAPAPVAAPPNPLSDMSLNAPGGAGGSNPEDDLHSAAQAQGQQDVQDQTNGAEDMEQVKKMVTDCLTKVRKQLPAIAKLQATDPDAYKSIIGLVQGVILMGKAVIGPQQPPDDELPQNVQQGMSKGEIASTPAQDGAMGMSEDDMLKDDSIPDGTVVNQKMKVRHADGSTSWKSMEAGMIASQDRGSGPFGANSHPTSSREPSAR